MISSEKINLSNGDHLLIENINLNYQVGNLIIINHTSKKMLNDIKDIN